MKKIIKIFSFFWLKFREYCDPAFEEPNQAYKTYRVYKSNRSYGLSKP